MELCGAVKYGDALLPLVRWCFYLYVRRCQCLSQRQDGGLIVSFLEMRSDDVAYKYYGCISKLYIYIFYKLITRKFINTLQIFYIYSMTWQLFESIIERDLRRK